MLSLLHLLQVESGCITIDGQDIANISPSLLRKKLNCLTQEPFIHNGTIRQNMDPLSTGVSDIAMIDALKEVGIWNVVLARTTANTTDSDPLDAELAENVLSHGQRQLFAMARAMLRKSRILLLDEPTSRYVFFVPHGTHPTLPYTEIADSWNRLDTETHERVQAVIRSRRFTRCTVVMIAHRLDSIVDFDGVVVLDGGRVVESGCPRTLLADSDSAFARLYRGESLDSAEE